VTLKNLVIVLLGTIMMSGSRIVTNGKGTRREYGEFNLDELQVFVISVLCNLSRVPVSISDTQVYVTRSFISVCEIVHWWWLLVEHNSLIGLYIGRWSHWTGSQVIRSSSLLHQRHWSRCRGKSDAGAGLGCGWPVWNGSPSDCHWCWQWWCCWSSAVPW